LPNGGGQLGGVVRSDGSRLDAGEPLFDIATRNSDYGEIAGHRLFDDVGRALVNGGDQQAVSSGHFQGHVGLWCKREHFQFGHWVAFSQLSHRRLRKREILDHAHDAVVDVYPRIEEDNGLRLSPAKLGAGVRATQRSKDLVVNAVGDDLGAAAKRRR